MQLHKFSLSLPYIEFLLLPFPTPSLHLQFFFAVAKSSPATLSLSLSLPLLLLPPPTPPWHFALLLNLSTRFAILFCLISVFIMPFLYAIFFYSRDKFNSLHIVVLVCCPVVVVVVAVAGISFNYF